MYLVFTSKWKQLVMEGKEVAVALENFPLMAVFLRPFLKHDLDLEFDIVSNITFLPLLEPHTDWKGSSFKQLEAITLA